MAVAHRTRRAPALAEAELAACQRGDEVAIERLCARSVDMIYRWAVFQGLPPADAEDVTQRVLLTATTKIAQCTGVEALPSWLYQITRRTVANHRRSSWWRRWLSASAPLEPAFAERGHHDLELETSVREALAQLAPPLAEVLILSDLEERSRSEVAAMLGVPEGTVASRLRQARAAFSTTWRGEVSHER